MVPSLRTAFPYLLGSDSDLHCHSSFQSAPKEEAAEEQPEKGCKTRSKEEMQKGLGLKRVERPSDTFRPSVLCWTLTTSVVG